RVRHCFHPAGLRLRRMGDQELFRFWPTHGFDLRRWFGPGGRGAHWLFPLRVEEVERHQLPVKPQRVIGLLIGGLALGAALLPQTGAACAACFGKSDSKMAHGMNMGIVSLLAVVVFMQLAVGGFFFVFLKRRAAKIAAGRAVPEAGEAAEQELSSTPNQD